MVRTTTKKTKDSGKRPGLDFEAVEGNTLSLTAEQIQLGSISVTTTSRHTGALKWLDGVLMQEFETVEYRGGFPISDSREWVVVPTETKDTTK